jgi:hypothetical protein
MTPQEREEFTMLRERVSNLEQSREVMEKSIAKMSTQLDHLVALANQSRGAMWAGGSLMALLGAAAGWVGSWIHGGGPTPPTH